MSPEVGLEVGVSPCPSRFRGKAVPVQAVRLYGGVEVRLQLYLTSAIDGGEWSVPRPRRCSPWERAPETRLRGGPRNGLYLLTYPMEQSPS